MNDRRSAQYYLERLALRAPANHAIWRASEAAAIMSWPISRPMLDVGCGDGSFAQLLFPAGVDVGVDMRFDQLQRAHRRKQYRLQLRADAARLPFADESFSTVFSNCVLEHVEHVDEACREIGRVLRPGGQFIFTVPTDQFPRYLLVPRLLRQVGLSAGGTFYTDTLNGRFKHYHVDHPDRWKERCNAAGMRVVDMKFLMPPRAEGLWDALMPLAALQSLTRALGRRRFVVERTLTRLLARPLAPLMASDDAVGGNIAIRAVRE